MYIREMEMIANLIEKQQREIYRLNRKQTDDEMLKDTFIERDYISKDKIREKLDYQYMLWNTPNRQKEYNQEVVDILEELLKEK